MKDLKFKSAESSLMLHTSLVPLVRDLVPSDPSQINKSFPKQKKKIVGGQDSLRFMFDLVEIN